MPIDTNTVLLKDLFTDAFELDRTVTVYNNDKMQAVVFVAVQFYGESSDEATVINYVQTEAVIKYKSSTEYLKLEWDRSTVSNEYQHSICDANSKSYAAYFSDGSSSGATYRNLRIPLYFTVPKTSAVTGTHTWICQLKEMTSPISTPVNITVKSYVNEVKPEDIEIVELQYWPYGRPISYRALQYKHNAKGLPGGHRLYKHAGNDGMRFFKEVTYIGRYQDGPWIPVCRKSDDKKAIVVFPKLNESNTYIMSGYPIYGPGDYQPEERLNIFKDNPDKEYDFRSPNGSEIGIDSDTWDICHGIMMIRSESLTIQYAEHGTSNWTDVTYEIQDLTVEDNYGNEFKIKIDFDYKCEEDDDDCDKENDDKYYEVWKVLEFDDA